jgi:hypothetical protein
MIPHSWSSRPDCPQVRHRFLPRGLEGMQSRPLDTSGAAALRDLLLAGMQLSAKQSEMRLAYAYL